MKHSQTYEYEPTGLGILNFHAWLMRRPELRSFSSRVWNILYHGLRLAESIHWNEKRNNDKSPYSTHFIEIIIDHLEKYKEKNIDPDDLLVFALHDAIEEHPDRWREILEMFGLDIFRDILVLSTGGIPLRIRGEMLHYFNKYHSSWSQIEHKLPLSHQDEILLEIIRLISPLDPFLKLHNKSRYSENTQSQEFQQIENAMHIYTEKIILGKDKVPEEKLPENDAYIGIGNYCYFRKKDARRKLRDMLHNMRDMELMEIKKPGYIYTRRIKAYILGVKLKTFGMNSELAELESAFLKAGYKMFTHLECTVILHLLTKLKSIISEIKHIKPNQNNNPDYIESLTMRVYDLGEELKDEDMNEEYIQLKDQFEKTGNSILQDQKLLSGYNHARYPEL